MGKMTGVPEGYPQKIENLIAKGFNLDGKPMLSLNLVQASDQ